MNRTRTFALATSFLTFACLPLGAQGRGQPKSNRPPAAESRVNEHAASRRATADEMRTIHQYYRSNTAQVKPIPPGILRNLVRGKAMPPGIERTRIPDGLVGRLATRPGYTWYEVGDRLVLVNPNGVVVDIVRR